MASNERGMFVDTFDIYAAKYRKTFIAQTAADLFVEENTIKKDLGRLLLKLEELQDNHIEDLTTPKAITPLMTDDLRLEAAAKRRRADDRQHRQGRQHRPADHAGIPRRRAGDDLPDHHGHQDRRRAAEPLPGADGGRRPASRPRRSTSCSANGKRCKGCWSARTTRRRWPCTATPNGLLRPLLVANPFAESLTFLDDRTRTRRDHVKYLTLIRAITLLHQHQRPVKTIDHQGRQVEYIEVTLDDIEVANRLANEVLGRAVDDLPPQTRRLLQAD